MVCVCVCLCMCMRVYVCLGQSLTLHQHHISLEDLLIHLSPSEDAPLLRNRVHLEDLKVLQVSGSLITHDITLHYIMSHHIASQHVTSYDIT